MSPTSRIYRPNTTWSWLFILLAIAQTCIVLACEGYVFARFQNNIRMDNIKLLPKIEGGRLTEQNQATEYQRAQTRTIPTYLILFIFAHIFLVVLCYDALRLKNTIQIIGICIFDLALLLYAAIQMDQIRDANTALADGFGDLELQRRNIWPPIKPFLIIIPCIIAASSIAMLFVCYRLYDEFAWKIYKHISADVRMKRRYLTFQIFIALLKFDVFFFVGFTIQFIVIVASTTGYVSKSIAGLDYEFYVTIAALPITIAFLALAAWCTRHEKRYAMWAVVVVFFAALAYFIFKLVRMFQPETEQSYKPARRSLTTFAVITIILIVLTIANAIACILNFDKGLKKHLNESAVGEDNKDQLHMTEMGSNPAHPVPSRMTIE